MSKWKLLSETRQFSNWMTADCRPPGPNIWSGEHHESRFMRRKQSPSKFIFSFSRQITWIWRPSPGENSWYFAVPMSSISSISLLSFLSILWSLMSQHFDLSSCECDCLFDRKYPGLVFQTYYSRLFQNVCLVQVLVFIVNSRNFYGKAEL